MRDGIAMRSSQKQVVIIIEELDMCELLCKECESGRCFINRHRPQILVA